MAAIRELSTGAQRAVRPRIRIQPPVPMNYAAASCGVSTAKPLFVRSKLRGMYPKRFNRTASAALDDLVLQLEQRPGRWKTRILRLRKLILERRAMGRAGR